MAVDFFNAPYLYGHIFIQLVHSCSYLVSIKAEICLSRFDQDGRKLHLGKLFRMVVSRASGIEGTLHTFLGNVWGRENPADFGQDRSTERSFNDAQFSVLCWRCVKTTNFYRSIS